MTAAKALKTAATKPTKAQPAQAPAKAQDKPQAVALRGGAAVASVKLTGKPYKSAAKHNTDWWAQITKAQGGAVTDLVKAGVPTHFIGYTMRRGYLQAA